jgi:hypothetical protein
MNRPVRMIRILMKITCMARENTIDRTSFLLFLATMISGLRYARFGMR